jgi:hypothetical protein
MRAITMLSALVNAIESDWYAARAGDERASLR